MIPYTSAVNEQYFKYSWHILMGFPQSCVEILDIVAITARCWDLCVAIINFGHSANSILWSGQKISLISVIDSVAVAVHVGRAPLALLLVKFSVERNRLLVIQRLEAVLVDRREVDEDVLAAIVGGDEAETLLAEELDFTGDPRLGLSVGPH